MFQIILTVIIIAVAVGFAIYRAIGSIRNPLKECEGCDKSCGGCSLEELKNEINAKKSVHKK